MSVKVRVSKKPSKLAVASPDFPVSTSPGEAATGHIAPLSLSRMSVWNSSLVYLQTRLPVQASTIQTPLPRVRLGS